MSTWEERKAISDAHEQYVAEEFRRRLWVVAPWGQGHLPTEIRDAIYGNDYRDRYQPDLIAARDGDVVKVDCKTRMRSTDTGRFAISRHCVDAGLNLLSFGPPVFYVLGDDMRVITPSEVQAYCTVGPRARGGAYYLVPEALGHPFDVVFGEGPEVALSAA